MYLFLIIVIAINGAVHGFLYWRFVAAFAIASPAWLWTLRGLFAFLTLSYIIARTLESTPVPMSVLTTLNWIASVWMGFTVQFLWIGLLTFFIHLILLVTGLWQKVPFDQQILISRTTGIVAIAFAAVICSYGYWRAHAPAVVNEYNVPLKGYTQELAYLKVVQVADFHAGMLIGAERLLPMVEQVQALNPDLILVPGDIIDAPPHLLRDLIPVFDRLDAPLGVYGTTGNHEYYIGHAAAIKLIEESGITMLSNRTVELPCGLNVSGIDDRTARQMGLPRPNVEELLGEAARLRPTILLDHTPGSAEVDAATRAGADLVLCGHTHGGQLWPFTYLVRAAFPYFHGMYKSNSGKVITTCGIGYWGPPMRIAAPPEINVIRFVPK